MKAGVAAVLAVGFALSATGVRADDERVWMGADYDGGATLVYGVPETDDAPIAFNCELPARDLVLNLSLGEAFEPRSGEVPVKISAGSAKESVALAGQVQYYEEIGDTVLEARGHLTPPLAAMLAKGKTLTVLVGAQKRTFPLKGAAEGMKQLSAACADGK